MNEFLFYMVVFAAHIIQGITGFGGAILAMPPALFLVGAGVATPIINGLGIMSGLYVLAGNVKQVDRRVLIHVLGVMAPFVVVGALLHKLLAGQASIMYAIFGVIILLVAIGGLIRLFRTKTASADTIFHTIFYELLLVLAGVVHGMFACAGPFLVGYLARRLPQKDALRSTVSVVWVVLGVLLLIAQIALGEWNLDLVRIQLETVPFLLAGMFVGSIVFRRVSQRAFTVLVYILLGISGVLLLMH
ncbi:MAG: sulfite exporter TauE/SafE family protein [Eggerthellaceae bacterium]|nr:sulfite exporter TauE/SafE family protein [Eggerthellaceae bacterium]